MATTNQIGIDAEKATQLAEKLNVLLANYQLFYINARGFHWNIAGEKFFELHAKFEELYNDAIVKIDEIAERILTLGHTPLHTFTSYLETSTIKEVSNVSEGRQAVQEVLNSFSVLISSERELLELAGDANDEGTNALMSDYIREQEKLVWMYSAYLKG
ncbi:Dps family protein [Pontibacter sp. SGAir0037]|uniref:Dps family protein n=1 Tax=Pontibacter sp. SGAir0037 TaxID=2571030 RepID=UPI0010CD5515|nr:Dps family protein [Pontibacter sp. SGAir0037]QCR21050.1 DNA starvation/stationary phase protection protein [Pontibacter sp. SGAir0037]